MIFLRKFYNQTYQGLFKNADKVCGFKELPSVKMEIEEEEKKEMTDFEPGACNIE